MKTLLQGTDEEITTQHPGCESVKVLCYTFINDLNLKLLTLNA